jgi:cell pole-organizing protein PopZ
LLDAAPDTYRDEKAAAQLPEQEFGNLNAHSEVDAMLALAGVPAKVREECAGQGAIFNYPTTPQPEAAVRRRLEHDETEHFKWFVAEVVNPRKRSPDGLQPQELPILRRKRPEDEHRIEQRRE